MTVHAFPTRRQLACLRCPVATPGLVTRHQVPQRANIEPLDGPVIELRLRPVKPLHQEHAVFALRCRAGQDQAPVGPQRSSRASNPSGLFAHHGIVRPHGEGIQLMVVRGGPGEPRRAGAASPSQAWHRATSHANRATHSTSLATAWGVGGGSKRCFIPQSYSLIQMSRSCSTFARFGRGFRAAISLGPPRTLDACYASTPANRAGGKAIVRQLILRW